MNEKIIHDYIKEHLRIHITRDYYSQIRVAIYLDDEWITDDCVNVDTDESF